LNPEYASDAKSAFYYPIPSSSPALQKAKMTPHYKELGPHVDPSLHYNQEDDKIIQYNSNKKRRGNYKCSRCRIAKKGHVCPVLDCNNSPDELTTSSPCLSPQKSVTPTTGLANGRTDSPMNGRNSPNTPIISATDNPIWTNQSEKEVVMVMDHENTLKEGEVTNNTRSLFKGNNFAKILDGNQTKESSSQMQKPDEMGKNDDNSSNNESSGEVVECLQKRVECLEMEKVSLVQQNHHLRQLIELIKKNRSPSSSPTAGIDYEGGSPPNVKPL